MSCKGKINLADRADRDLSYFQLVGDIAIVSLPLEDQSHNHEIARAIMANHTRIKTILNKVSKLKGDHRLASFEILNGAKTDTIHRENGFLYHLDVTQTFFSSRLSYEHARIASQVKEGEMALVPFAGVGPFVIPMAARGAKVLAIEKNSNACRYLQENTLANRLAESIRIVKGDAFLVPTMLKTKFDRAVIPAPYGIDHLIDRFLPALKVGGKIHIYAFKKKHQIPELLRRYEEMDLELTFYRRCGNVAPKVFRWVFDLLKC